MGLFFRDSYLRRLPARHRLSVFGRPCNLTVGHCGRPVPRAHREQLLDRQLTGAELEAVDG